MTSPRIKRLRSKRAKVVRELESVDREIDRVEKWLGVESSERTEKPSRVLRRPNARRLNEVTVKDAIVDLLRQKRKPMHYREIANELIDTGRYRTRSKNFASTVAITILRDRRLTRVGPGVYGLKKSA